MDDITRPPARVYFTIAHEIGHVVLGHLEHSELAEFEANIFARCLIAPYGIVRNLDEEEFNIEFISERFGISAEAAMYCRDRSLALYLLNIKQETVYVQNQKKEANHQ